MEEGKEDGEKGPQGSPFSPFPYGSPLQRASTASRQTSYTGSPAQKILLSTFNRSKSKPVHETNGDFAVTPRLKSQDLYGGPVMFGSSARRNRLLAASPYSTGFRMRDRAKSRSISGAAASNTLFYNNTSLQGGPNNLSGLGHTSLAAQGGGLGSTGNSSRATPTPENPWSDAMSTTARVILDALDKMSTPIQDALKVPVARAEKRKLVEDQLNSSLGASGRRRPRLGAGPNNGRSPLSGPPLRKNYSPLPVASAPRNNKSAAASILSRAPLVPTPPPPAEPPAPTASAASSLSAAPPALTASSTTTAATSSALPTFGGVPSSSSPPSSTDTSKPSFSSSGAPTPLFTTSSKPFMTSTPAPKAASLKPLSTSTPAPSSMKMKNKVTGRGAQEEDNELAPPPPAFLLNNTPVLKVPSALPCIPLNVPTPGAVKSTSSVTDGQTSALLVASTTVSSSSSVVSPFKDVFRLNKPTAVVSASQETTTSEIKFAFAQPISTAATATAKQASTDINFTFRAPRPVVGATARKIESVKSVYAFTLPSSAVSLTGETRLGEDITTTTSVAGFKSAAMPDVTNNLKSKDDNMQGRRKDSLPDVTASTGFAFGAAKQLKAGSVMDILGGGKKF